MEVIVGRCITDVENGRQAEDDARFELKSKWPPPNADTARRVAAHANSARGDDIIWVIGVDEKARKVTGAEASDPAQWEDQLRNHFANRWAPSVRPQVIPWGNTNVVALIFGTIGAPFLVRFGENTEVPWRGSTRVRSATRFELLEMLTPLVRAPEVEILDGRLGQSRSPSEITPIRIRLALILYLAAHDDHDVVLPLHRMKVSVLNGRGRRLDLRFAKADVNRLVSPMATKEVPIESPFLHITTDEVVFSRACRLRLLAYGEERRFDPYEWGDHCTAEITLRPTSASGTVVLRPQFFSTSPEDDEEEAWQYVPDDVIARR